VMALNHRQHLAYAVAHSNLVACFELNHCFPLFPFHIPIILLLSAFVKGVLILFPKFSKVVVSRYYQRTYGLRGGPRLP
jgi:hypothetical protein